MNNESDETALPTCPVCSFDDRRVRPHVIDGTDCRDHVLQERVCRAKHVQMVSGTSAAAYWTSHFVADFASYAASAVLIVGCLVYYGDQVLVTRLLHVCCMAVTWLLHGFHMAFTWLLHGCYMAFTWLLQASSTTALRPGLRG